MRSMVSYSKAAMERAMKVQEVILRAMAKRITWWQAAEIIGISDRHMRRWRERYEEFGYDGLFDRRRGKPSPRRVPLGVGGQEVGRAHARTPLPVKNTMPASSSKKKKDDPERVDLAELYQPPTLLTA